MGVNRIKEIRDQLKKKAEDTNGKPDVWTPEEELMVNKAASKVFPPGTQGNRWAKIGEYVQTHAHTEWIRSEKEVVKKVNELKNVNEALTSTSATPTTLKSSRRTRAGTRTSRRWTTRPSATRPGVPERVASNTVACRL